MLILGTFMIPSISGLPLTPAAEFYVPFWLIVLMFTNTKILFSKGFFIGYLFLVFHFLYSFFGFYPSDRNNTRFMLDEVIPILFSFSIIEYFQNTKRSDDIRKISNLLFFGTIATTVTSGIALTIYPDAARMLAGALSLEDNQDLSSYYSLIGIGGFNFYIYLALLPPIYLIIILNSRIKKIKIIFFGIYFATFLTVIISQYTASIVLFVITSLASILFLRVKSVPAYILFFLLLIFLYFNVQLISDSIVSLSNYINLENVSPRLKNIAYIIDGSEMNQSTADLQYALDYQNLKDISFDSFNSNVLTGGGKIGDHVFWYDVLGNYGLIGLIPWVIFFVYTFRSRVRLYNNQFKGVFVIIFFSLLFIGFHKPFRSFSLLPYLCIILPLILLKIQIWMNSNKTFLKS
jgi:hypothetical protein